MRCLLEALLCERGGSRASGTQEKRGVSCALSSARFVGGPDKRRKIGTSLVSPSSAILFRASLSSFRARTLLRLSSMMLLWASLNIVTTSCISKAIRRSLGKGHWQKESMQRRARAKRATWSPLDVPPETPRPSSRETALGAPRSFHCRSSRSETLLQPERVGAEPL